MKKAISLLLALCLCLSLCACSSGDYKKATELYAKGDYAAAATIFEQLADYKDSAEQLNACRYQMALQFMKDEQYDEALALLEPLGNYQDCPEKIRECNYRKALDLMAGEQFDKALALLEPLSDYEDSAERSKECRYQLAMKDYAAGKVKEAVEALSYIYDYPAAKKDLNQILLDEVTKNYTSRITEAANSYSSYTNTWTKQTIAIVNRTKTGDTINFPEADENDPDIMAIRRSMEKGGAYLEELSGIFNEDVLNRCQDEALANFLEVLQSSHEAFVKYFNPTLFSGRFQLTIYFSQIGQSTASINAEFNTAIQNLMDAAEALGTFPEFG